MATNSVLARKKAHARKSFSERYNIRLDDDLAKQFVEQIQNRTNASRVCFISHRVSVWMIYVPKELIAKGTKGVWVPVVYDKNLKLISTALPPECREVQHIDPNSQDFV